MPSSTAPLPPRAAGNDRLFRDVHAAAAVITSAPDVGLTVIFERISSAGRYRASLGGEVIVASSREPILAACRALVARGLTGRASFKRPGDKFAAMIVRDVVEAAKWTVSETEAHGPRLVRHRPFNEAVDTGAVQ